MTNTSPADTLRAAADKLRKLIAAVPREHWGDRPWHAEECSDTDDMSSCPCIVAQGEYREFDQPQIPPIQYVADAENPDFAAYIAAMHPGVAEALAKLLEQAAEWEGMPIIPGNELALAVARAVLGEETRS